MENLKKLIQIANKAKDIREYFLANAIFAFVLNEVLDHRYFEKEEVSLRLETKDEGLYDICQIYYDIFGIEIEKEYLCIPVPFISGYYATAMIKANILITENIGHFREQRDPEDREVQNLWVEAVEIETGIKNLENIENVFNAEVKAIKELKKFMLETFQN